MLKGAWARWREMEEREKNEDPILKSKRNVQYFVDHINAARHSPEELAKALNLPLTIITKYINKGLIALKTRQELDGETVIQVCKILDPCVLPFSPNNLS